MSPWLWLAIIAGVAWSVWLICQPLPHDKNDNTNERNQE